jgi:hypothetical protein
MKYLLMLVLLSHFVVAQSVLITPGSAGAGSINLNSQTVFTNRLRINHGGGNTAGMWFSNSSNSRSIIDGAFYGMKTNFETGMFIGGAWRFWINSSGVMHSTWLTGSGTRVVYANPDGSLTTGNTQKVHAVSGLNFRPFSVNTNQLVRVGLFDVHGNIGESYPLISSIELENGAKISKLEIDYFKNVSFPDFRFTLMKAHRYNPISTNIAMFTTSADNSTGYSTATITTSEVIDNTQYYYFLHVVPWYNTTWSNWLDPIYLRFKGFRVFYTL